MMTGTEATALARPTSMEDVKDQIASRIRASFVELMPEDAWRKLVEAEVTQFMAIENRGYGHQRSSRLQDIVRTVLEERYCEMLKEELAKPEYGGYFDAPGEFIQTFLKDNMTSIVAALTAGLGQNLIEQVKRSIQEDAASRY